MLDTEFAYTKLVVGDIDRSVDFYTRVLGMSEVQRVAFRDPGAVEVVLAHGGVPRLILMSGERLPVHSGQSSYTAVVFAVPDATVAHEQLSAAGHQVVVDAPLVVGPATVCILADPDGYLVELISVAQGTDLKGEMDFGLEADGTLPHPIPEIHDLLLK